jgi:V8-like Glu-specific endopeptidase
MATEKPDQGSGTPRSPSRRLLALQSAQLDLREQELRTREQQAELASKSWLRKASDPLVIAIIGAALGLVANLVSGVMQAKQARDLEAEKGRATLIQEFIKTGDSTKAKDNLKFLLSAGILTDPDGKIAKALESSPPISLPSATPFDSGRENLGDRAETLPMTDPLGVFIRATGILSTATARGESICTAMALSKDTLLTGDHCVSEAGDASKMIFRQFSSREVPKDFRIAIAARRNGALDYSLLRVDTNDGPLVEVEHIRTRSPQIGESLAIVSAPMGTLRVFRACRVLAITTSQFTHSCNTNPGSTGGIVIGLSDMSILGMHIGKGANLMQGGIATRFDVISAESKSLDPSVPFVHP